MCFRPVICLSSNTLSPVVGCTWCQNCIGKRWGQQSPSKTTCQSAKNVNQQCKGFSPPSLQQANAFMFSVLVRRSNHSRCETKQQAAQGCVTRHLGEDQFQQSNKRDDVQKSTTNISETHRLSNVQLPPHPTPTCFYSSNPVQQADRGTHVYMFTCTLISTGLCQHVY